MLRLTNLLILFSVICLNAQTMLNPDRANTINPPSGGGGIPVIESYTDNFVNGSTIVATKPSGVAVGDLLVIIPMNEDGSNDPQWAQDSVQTDDFTFLMEVGDNQVDMHLAVFWRIADGTEAASIDVNSVASVEQVVYYLRISGADLSNPIDSITTGTLSAAADTTIIIAGIESDIVDCLAFYAAGFDGGYDGGANRGLDSVTVSGTGWSVHSYIAGGNKWGPSGHLGTKDLESAGASGSATLTAYRVFANGSDGWAGIQFIVRSPD